MSPARVELGDNLEVCGRLYAEGLRCQLIYVDPPFGVGTTHGARTARGEARGEVTTAAYEDAFVGIESFLVALRPRLAIFRELLEPRGTLYLHLDHRTVHDAKVLADGVFGRGAFRGEIVWAPGNGGRRGEGWTPTHQTILVYTRDDRQRGDFVFHGLREPYAEESAKMHFRNVDERGRRYRVRKIGGREYRYFLDEGRRMGTVWTDLPAMAANTPFARETTGYPHQKPEGLLERIVRASSDEGACVGDFFCGSGTTLAVAKRLGRSVVGCDASPLAIEVTKRRLFGRDPALLEVGS